MWQSAEDQMTEQRSTTPKNQMSERHDLDHRPTALFIDIENFYNNRKRQYEFDHKQELYQMGELANDLAFLLQWLKQGVAKLTMMRGYASFTHRFIEIDSRTKNPIRTDPRTNRPKTWAVFADAIDYLMRLGIEPILVPPLAGTKNAADMRLAIDAGEFVEAGEHGRRVVIVASDSDYIPVTLRLRRMGAEVVVVGTRESTGQYLSSFADYFFTFEDLVEQDRQKLELEKAEQKSLTDDDLRNILGRIEPRFVLVSFDNWIKTTDEVYKWMVGSAPTTLNDLVSTVQDELAAHIDVGSSVVIDVVNQLRDSGCFARWKDGKQLSEPVTEFQQDVRLAAGINSAEEMRVRTRRKITDILRERLGPLSLEKEVLARLFFGSNPSDEEIKEAASLLTKK
jgi:uncharacterized LabA/DUF88 family protein